MECKTEYKKFHERCEQCKYFRVGVRSGGGWFEICAAINKRIIRGDGRLIKSDNCPFKEV